MSEKNSNAARISLNSYRHIELKLSLKDYGVSSKYDRKKFDSQAARKRFHEKQFGNKQTIKGKNGELLHRSHAAAERKYGAERASYHSAQADHIDPLKNIYERHKYNLLLTDEDIKDVGNRVGNFQELDRHSNASKGENSEFQEGIKTKDLKRAAKGLKVQAETDILLTERAAQNALKLTVEEAKVAAEAGKNTALVALTVSGLNNLADVSAGRKDLKTALKDVASDTASSFVSGAGLQVTTDLVSGIASLAGAEKIVEMTSNGLPAAEITMLAMTANSVKKYLDGDISGEDCAIEILRNGAGMLAYQLGTVLGGPAGAVIASVVMTQVMNTIMEYRQAKKIAQSRAAEVDRVLAHAMQEITHQKDLLSDYVKNELQHWDDVVNDGMSLVLRSAHNQDTDGITRGLNRVLELFNQKVVYASSEEFDRDFFDPHAAPLVL